jgi:hypothetical protein
MTPFPRTVAAIAQAVLPLNAWKSTNNPPDAFWSNSTDTQGRGDVQAGGRGGFGGRGSRGGGNQAGEFTLAYKTQIAPPADWSGKRIVLRFESVGGDAKVWVNGREVKLRGIWGGNNISAMKALNVNHTRQKWVSEQILKQADRLGLYVLDETPVDFAKFGAEADPLYAYQWLTLVSDLIGRDRDRPSVSQSIPMVTLGGHKARQNSAPMMEDATNIVKLASLRAQNVCILPDEATRTYYSETLRIAGEFSGENP